MLEKSACHTIDRHSFKAQLDCNKEQSVLKAATERNFNTTKYWPYMHNADVSACISKISKDSWQNMVQEGAVFGVKGFWMSGVMAAGLFIISYL